MTTQDAPPAPTISGPVPDACMEHSVVNIDAFIKELGMEAPAVAVTMHSPEHDGTGRYQFVLHRGIRTVDVDMPGIPLGEVRCTKGDRLVPPRLYVDGNSWLWCYGLGFARSALVDHDGTIERRIDESRRASDSELDACPYCASCGGVRSVEITNEDLYLVRCYVCEPEFETRRETLSGALFGDEAWKRVSHYLVKRQYMAPEVPGNSNPMHPDALCGARLQHGVCRLKARHTSRCEDYWKVLERTLVAISPDGSA